MLHWLLPGRRVGLAVRQGASTPLAISFIYARIIAQTGYAGKIASLKYEITYEPSTARPGASYGLQHTVHRAVLAVRVL